MPGAHGASRAHGPAPLQRREPARPARASWSRATARPTSSRSRRRSSARDEEVAQRRDRAHRASASATDARAARGEAPCAMRTPHRRHRQLPAAAVADQRRISRRASRRATSGSATRTGIRAAPHRRRGADPQRPRAAARRAALERPGITAGGRRPHHRRDLDARHDLPVDRVPAAGEARREAAARRSTCRRCAPASSTRSPSRTASCAAGRASRARGRRRDLLAHPRLERPRHLRALRRRRRRGGARCPREAGILRRTLHADGSHADILSVPGNVCGGASSGSPLLQMDGASVFKFAVKVLDDVARGDAGRHRHDRRRRSTG